MITGLNPLRAFDPLSVKPDLSGPEPLLLRSKTYVRREAFNKSIQPLSCLIGCDFNLNGQDFVPSCNQTNIHQP